MLNISHTMTPNEVIYEIFELCDFNTLLKSSLICDNFNIISRETINIYYIVRVYNIDLLKSYIPNKLNLRMLQNKITDHDLSYLSEVHTIDLNWCKNITNEGLQYLSGVNNLSFNGKKINLI